MAAKKTTKSPLLKLSVGGRELPCRVTMGAMLRFKREAGHDITKMDQTDLEEMLLFMWCCVTSACAVDGIDFDMDFMRFADLLDVETMTAFYDGMNGTAVDEKKS